MNRATDTIAAAPIRPPPTLRRETSRRFWISHESRVTCHETQVGSVPPALQTPDSRLATCDLCLLHPKPRHRSRPIPILDCRIDRALSAEPGETYALGKRHLSAPCPFAIED